MLPDRLPLPSRRSSRRPNSVPRWPSLCGVALASAALAGEAGAQQTGGGISLNAQQITRQLERRPTGQRPNWISYKDCVDGDSFSFPVTVTATDLALEVWAGTSNCPDLRETRDRQQCWLVASEGSISGDSFRVEVPVRNVVARMTDTLEAPTDLGADVCSNSTQISGEAITYYFMLVSGGQTVASTSWGGGSAGNADTGIDVVGPPPPNSIAVRIGDGQLSVRIDAPTESADRTGFRAFCVPVGTPGPARDAGAQSGGLDAGADASSAAATAGDAGVDCVSEVLIADEIPPLDPAFECGETGRATRNTSTDRLENDVRYAVAVASEDDVGNVGPVSNVACATPIALQDFWELYSDRGGQGGGGYCSLELGRRPGALAGLSLVALIGLVARRRKKAC